MDVSAAEISDRKEDISTGIPHHKPQKRPRLKSLVIGTAVFGAVLMLLHLRFVCFQGLAVTVTEFVWVGSTSFLLFIFI